MHRMDKGNNKWLFLCTV